MNHLQQLVFRQSGTHVC